MFEIVCYSFVVNWVTKKTKAWDWLRIWFHSLMVKFLSGSRLLAASTFSSYCLFVVPYTSTLFWKMTTPLISLKVDWKQFWKIDENFFKPWGSLHILNNPCDLSSVQIFLHHRPIHFDNICLISQFCQSKRPHGYHWICSPCLGSDNPRP